MNHSGITIIQYLEKSSFTDVFQKQISSLTMIFCNNKPCDGIEGLFTNAFINVLTTCTNLTYLSFYSQDACTKVPRASLTVPSTPCFTSNLVYLNVAVSAFDHCLCLLDGYFTQLQTLIIKVGSISDTSRTIQNTVKIF